MGAFRSAAGPCELQDGSAARSAGKGTTTTQWMALSVRPDRGMRRVARELAWEGARELRERVRFIYGRDLVGLFLLAEFNRSIGEKFFSE